MNSKSPYISSHDRLAHVIAAIQAMGTYKYYKLDFDSWADRISGSEADGSSWKKLFEEHPEFFRLDSRRIKASLVWRRQHPKRFDVDCRKEISRDEFYALSDEKKQRISRLPLSTDELSTLINAAMNLHSRALEQHKDKRWWITGGIAIVGVIVGALLG